MIAPLPDATGDNWAERLLPAALLPYSRLARWDRPVGWQLLLLPCWISAALAEGGVPDLWHGLLFAIGAIAMRGAGSTYNDIIDRNLDAKIERTRNRPLPSKQVSVRQALVFAVLQSLIGLIVLLQFNAFAIALGFASTGLVLFYPFMKRITYMPQAVLGLAFGWGALMGWAVETQSLNLAPLLLYAGTCFWIIGYDTIYALQDIEDDEKAGVKSSARLFGDYVRIGVGLCYALTIVLVAMALLKAGSAWPAWLGGAGFALHLIWQVVQLDKNNGTGALHLFRSNRDAGLLLLAGLLLQ